MVVDEVESEYPPVNLHGWWDRSHMPTRRGDRWLVFVAWERP